MKRLLAVAVMLLVLPSLGRAPIHAQASPGTASDSDLFRTLASLDERLFAAYNRCDLDTLGTFVVEDLEFYHDQTGLMRSRKSMIEAVRANICGKVRRELVPGSLEVYPLHGYGAVQLGRHRFCPIEAEKCDESSGAARFIHLWQNQDGAWKITRVISYDHGGK